MSALITGATGLIGRRLLRSLGGGRALGRDPERARSSLGDEVQVFRWENTNASIPLAAFEGVETIYHFAGEPIAARRWTPEQKRRIHESRVNGTRRLIEAIAKLEARPSALVCASAVGFYGDRANDLLDESAGPDDSFLSQVCVAWEREAAEARALGLRVVNARIGMVLSPDGGALAKMLLPFRMGLGGPMGDGRQWMSWIHADDVVGLLRHAGETSALDGPMNVVSPHPITNADFSRALGRALGRPAILPAPRFALRLGFGELSDLLLASQRTVPKAALQSGYAYKYDELDMALSDCVKR